MSVPPTLKSFWNDYASSTGGADEGRFYEAFCFGDSEELAGELAELVLCGTKRATAGSVWSVEAEGRRLPRPGDLSIVTDWSGQPLCVIETQSVDVVPFREVTAEFAAAEGEGDGSLSYWREAHRRYLSVRVPAGSSAKTCSSRANALKSSTARQPLRPDGRSVAQAKPHQNAVAIAHGVRPGSVLRAMPVLGCWFIGMACRREPNASRYGSSREWGSDLDLYCRRNRPTSHSVAA